MIVSPSRRLTGASLGNWAALNVLNLVDWALTSHALRLGAYEVNPVMRRAFHVGLFVALAGKLWAVLLGSSALLYAGARRLMLAALVSYALVVCWEVAALGFWYP